MESKVPAPLERSETGVFPVETSYAPVGPSPTQQGPNIPHILLRRWKLVLLTSLVTCAVFLPMIWLLMKPEFTAMGAIEVTPVVPTIVFKDVTETPSYTSYMNTQALLMTSNSVINQVLDDPEVQKLPLVLNSNDPVAAVKSGLLAQTSRGTFLVRVSMTDKDPETAFKVANAAIRAYLSSDDSIAGSEDVKEQLIPNLLRKGERVRAVPVPGGTLSYRNVSEYLQVVGQALTLPEKFALDLDGFEDRGDGTWAAGGVAVAPTARLYGPVVLLEGCTVEDQTLVVGPAVIGRRARVGAGAVVTGSVLWDEASVGPGASVSGSLLDAGARVGRGLQVENGAIPGRGTAKGSRARDVRREGQRWG
jgi:capsular polysaccharide biosynthesis protein/acetyltransferase-like isoleucine patch superfamily enzyme